MMGAKYGDGWLSREMDGFEGRWVAKLVARLLAVAALWVRITEYTELLSGVHSVMRAKSVLAGEGGGCTPTPSHYIYPHQ